MENKVKHIKRVFTSSYQVYHLWANQSQSDARQSFRASFSGKDAYSYQARIATIQTYKGVKVGIVSNTRYSNTTSRHQREAYSSLTNLMPRLQASTFNVKAALLEVQGRLVDEIMDTLNKRTFYNYNDTVGKDSWLRKQIVEFNKTARALKHIELLLEIPEHFEDVLFDHVKYCIGITSKRNHEKQLKYEFEAKRREEEEARIYLKDWLAGNKSYNWTLQSIEPQMLRVVNNNVETTRGAVVALKDAREFLQRVLAGEAKQGDPIGDFKFNKLSEGIIQIGCHRIAVEHAKQVILLAHENG